MREITLDNDKIFLKKSFTGWKVVYPIKEDGKINWKHLIAGGSWLNLVGIAFLVGIILLGVSEYSTAVRVANECLANQVPLLLP